MRRGYLLLIASWIALGLSACTTFRSPHLEMEPAKACADWRWIGISRLGTRCPEISGWKVRPMFPQLAPAQQTSEEYCAEAKPEKVRGPKLELIRELNRFCVYEMANPFKKWKHLPLPPAVSADLVRLDKDCAGLSSSDAEETSDRRPDPKDFLSQAGQPETPLRIDGRRNVRLAFLDTEPDGEGVVGKRERNSPHGYTLAQIAQQLVCTPGGSDHCAAQITTRLALPIIEFDPKKWKDNRIDRVRGGYFGMQSDLAEAIRKEVDSWWTEKRQRHLVLNLSLAWDGDLFGGLDEDLIAEMKAGTQAVYRALQYASSFDVLVMAAAGNRKQDPCSNTGPLLPAAWERGGPKKENCGKPEARPLLYAVGGVDAGGNRLFNARDSGMPKRAACGENAVVPGWGPGERTEMYTGSSVATAVVSSIAAVVWDSFPQRDSLWVMDTLDASGDPLSFTANFWFGASAPPDSPPPVHRLSLCAALEAACRKDGSLRCPVEPPCPSWQPVTSRARNLQNQRLGSCQPWLLPQPEDPPCLGCPPRAYPQ